MADSIPDRTNNRPTVAASRWDWLDFNEDESRQVRDFLSQQTEGDGVDPLRIGASVRDAIADKLFPGTSTQYTRLRYVILAPALLAKPGVTLEGLNASQAAVNTSLASANKGETGVIGGRNPHRDFVHLDWSAIARWKLLVRVSGDERDVTVENGWKAFHRAARVDEDGSPLTQARVRWDTELLERVRRDCWKAGLEEADHRLHESRRRLPIAPLGGAGQRASARRDGLAGEQAPFGFACAVSLGRGAAGGPGSAT